MQKLPATTSDKTQHKLSSIFLIMCDVMMMLSNQDKFAYLPTHSTSFWSKNQYTQLLHFLKQHWMRGRGRMPICYLFRDEKIEIEIVPRHSVICCWHKQFFKAWNLPDFFKAQNLKPMTKTFLKACYSCIFLSSLAPGLFFTWKTNTNNNYHWLSRSLDVLQ